MHLALLILSSFNSLMTGARLNKNYLASSVSHALQADTVYSCICSTALGHAVKMECGNSCSVETCHRSNGKILALAPLLEGRGACCLSSISAIRDGCPLEATSITEAGAKDILADALKQAERNDVKSAFVVEGSEHLLDDMTESFDTAKEKEMNASRSGAQFFFSGNYRYILKSIHPPEYDVLQQLAAPGNFDTAPRSFKSQLAEHMDSFQLLDEPLRAVGNCVGLSIQPARDDWETTRPSAMRLAGHLPDVLYISVWAYSHAYAEVWGVPVYGQRSGNYMAFWCRATSGWEVHNQGFSRLNAEKVARCGEREETLYIELQIEPSAVDVVHGDFTLAFQEARSSIQRPIGSGTVTGGCIESWWPATLINDFVVAFRYQASSTWMVIRNSVIVVEDELKQHGFTTFFKKGDVFDVKPLPIISDQRELLFGMYFARSLLKTWRNWQSVRSNLISDVRFLDSALANPMVDYSLLVSAFYVDDSRRVLDYVQLPNCVEQPLSQLEYKPYGDGQGSILVCFAIIDMLMEFTLSKVPENTILFSKWSNWGEKVITMFDCLGRERYGKGCEKYNAFRPRYLGVDLPIDSAQYVDVTSSLLSDGRVVVKHNNTTIEKKCCCQDRPGVLMGRCQLTPLVNVTSYLFRNSHGCGSLLGGDYHSYWRYAKRCFISRDDALELRDEASMPGE